MELTLLGTASFGICAWWLKQENKLKSKPSADLHKTVCPQHVASLQSSFLKYPKMLKWLQKAVLPLWCDEHMWCSSCWAQRKMRCRSISGMSHKVSVWQASQLPRLASYRIILEGVTGTILSKSESYGCGQLAGQWDQRWIPLESYLTMDENRVDVC